MYNYIYNPTLLFKLFQYIFIILIIILLFTYQVIVNIVSYFNRKFVTMYLKMYKIIYVFLII